MQSFRESLPAPELLSTVTQPGLEVFQITTNPEAGTNLFYNYNQTLHPSSRFVLLNRTGRNGSQLLMCDLQDGFTLQPVTSEEDSVSRGFHAGACFSPDGRFIWYSAVSNDRFLLRRRPLEGGPVETVFDLPVSRPEFGGRKIFDSRWTSFSHDLSLIHI